MEQLLRRAFGVAAIGWAAALPLATWVASRPHQSTSPYALTMAVYAIGSWICHQRPERSFHVWAMQMPVCARCAGIYVGAALACIAQGVGLPLPVDGDGPPYARARAALVVAAAPIAATLVYEWTTGDVPSNSIRALSGLALGAAVAAIVVGGGRRDAHR